MDNRDDQSRIKHARLALCHINALDRRKRTPHWDAKAEAAMREAEAVVTATPGRLLLEAIRQMRSGGPQAIDPLGPPVVATSEESRRPRHDRDGLYTDTSMRPRWR